MQLTVAHEAPCASGVRLPNAWALSVRSTASPASSPPKYIGYLHSSDDARSGRRRDHARGRSAVLRCPDVDVVACMQGNS